MAAGERQRRRRLLEALGALLFGILAVATSYADDAHGLTVAQTARDVAVGIAFGIGALLSARPQPQRLIVALVGATWLAESFGVTPLLHRTALVAMILAFPAGRLTSRVHVVTACAAGVLVLVDRPEATIVLLVALALVCARDVRTLSDWRTYPVVAALALAAVQTAWIVSFRSPDLADTAVLWIPVYQVVLVLVALGHAPASRLADQERMRSVLARLQPPSDLGGGDRLATALREALEDPALELLPWDEAATGYVLGAGSIVRPRQPWVEVRDGDRPLALVVSESPLLTDARTATQVSDAVRVAVRAQHRQRERDNQLRELEAARRRLLVAADEQRRLVAERVTGDVLPPLREAAVRVAGVGRGDDTLLVVREELEAAEDELARMVAGVPPADLGGGRLPDALTRLAQRSHLPTSVTVDPGWSASGEVEATLYYVAAEALTNALKHADASRISLSLEGRDAEAVLEVRDDGLGGADRHGHGLIGLADRVATAGGRLTVTDGVPHGTIVRAAVPVVS